MSDAIYNIRRFVAQSGDITSLSLSQASIKLLATGGKDAKVNVWSLNKANCLLSLTGYSTNICAMQFHCNSEKLVAGENTGVFKVWDLEEAKLTNSFGGHKQATTCFQFHAFGDFLASASTDHMIKLWDLRRKGCIMTYKGHNSSISCLDFSPDGRWLASGDQDGLLKIWDMATHSTLSNFQGHVGGVSSMHFHPSELLISVGSNHGLCKVWDLDEKKELASMEFNEENKEEVRSVLFNQGGSHLLALTDYHLRVCGWEPSVVHHKIHTLHPLVNNTALHLNTLICADYNKNVVDTFAIDLEKIMNRKKTASSLNSTRKTFITNNKETDNINKRKSLGEGDGASEEGGVEINDPKYKKFFDKNVASPDDDDNDFSNNKKELEALNNLGEGHRRVLEDLRARDRCLQVVLREWTTKGLKNAVISAVSLREQSAIVDLLHVLLGNVNLWSLDICQHLLPVLEELVASNEEEYFHIGLSTLRLIGHTFGTVIRTNIELPPAYNEIDISRQDRYYKCKTCHKILSRINEELSRHLPEADKMGRLGSKIQEMFALIQTVVEY